jgi:uncharacterized protein
MNTTRRSVIAVGFGAGIGVLGGLIGLGGGEFRLPVLTSGFGYSARAAVPMNLIVSLITLATSLAIRAETLSFAPVGPYVVEVAALGVGGMVGARWSARLLTRLSDHRLEYAIAALLAAIGVLLIVEAFLPAGPAGLVTRDPVWLTLSGVLLGLAIGAVAALLSVAGGELLIPTLLFVYGVDIRTAGTASLMISLVTVASGLWRYGRLGALPGRDAVRTVAVPMGIGSIVGAIIGGMLVGILPVPFLKVFLGLVLIAAASKGFWDHRHG